MINDVDLAARFSRDYADARERFYAACRLNSAPVRSYTNPNKGPAGETLTTDVTWIGPKDATRALVLISATHGVEGFCGSGAQLDWLLGPASRPLPVGVALLVVHAINPHGFAWLRRVTEEGCDLNRNFIDFSKPLPQNPGYDEIADLVLPPVLSGPEFDATLAQIAAYKAKHGDRAWQSAFSQGQYKHPHGMFYGGTAPSWARRTLETIIDEYDLPARRVVGVIDYHTGLGPFGYGEPICGNPPGSAGLATAVKWYGESLTSPDLGTSSSVPKTGLSEELWVRKFGDRVIHVALEYGTYPPATGLTTLREDHWLHRYTNVDWSDPETKRIKAAIKHRYYPETRDWEEMILARSRQVIRQALAGLAAS
jgi:hypothetical protein